MTLMCTLAATSCAMLCAVLVPNSMVNKSPQAFGKTLVIGLSAQTILAFLSLLIYAILDSEPTQFALASTGSLASINLYFDGVSLLMFTLVSMIGTVVAMYSRRYLDGESQQGRYFRWLSFTLGCLCVMSIVGNLLLLFSAWFAASVGLHHLLTHYSDRVVAQRSAAAKFLISRLGDLLLVGAMIQLFRAYGTLNFEQLFTVDQTVVSTESISSAVWLLVFGAAIKTAQFPFHGWLPETMDTPTPVSALMHAGIVNAGGFLLIRMSPIAILVPEALACLALLGLLTACFGVVVMTTQTSVKRQLAYSTIAQMGFMMLQCGLGAFSAAMLHILAHAVYKAHAFFSSGSVLSVDSATRELEHPAVQKPKFHWFAFLIAAALPVLILTLAAQFIDVHISLSNLALPVILLFALAYWTYRVLALGTARAKWVATTSLIALVGFYALAYSTVDSLVSPVSFEHSLPIAAFLTAITLAAFGGLVLLQAQLSSANAPHWLSSLRVHASNGFYINALYRRIRSSYANS